MFEGNQRGTTRTGSQTTLPYPVLLRDSGFISLAIAAVARRHFERSFPGTKHQEAVSVDVRTNVEDKRAGNEIRY
jgi:hypothetical protein